MKTIIVDLGFGDAGKGSITDFLAHYGEYSTIVRYNGGPQAAHNVHVSGLHHTFSQFGSYLGRSRVATLLSRYMLIEPLALINEAAILETKGVENPFMSLYIDRRARVITPFHIILNRVRENMRGFERHGSCGMGVGETMRDYLENPEHEITANDFLDIAETGNSLILVDKLQTIQRHIQKELNELLKDDPAVEYNELPSVESFIGRYRKFWNTAKIVHEDYANQMIRQDRVLFEGAQGVLLDQDFGFHPYTTWSTTTSDNALALLNEAEVEEKPYIYGLTRFYMARHGHGPLPTENKDLRFKEDNVYNQWQQSMRYGYLDLPLLKYAITVNGGIDKLGLTHGDALSKVENFRICVSHKFITENYLTDVGKMLRSAKEQGRSCLEVQEALGKVLSKAESEYIDVPIKDVVPFIEEYLEIPIRIGSHGKDRDQKVFLTDQSKNDDMKDIPCPVVPFRNNKTNENTTDNSLIQQSNPASN